MCNKIFMRAAALAGALLLARVGGAQDAPPPFRDVPQDHWAYCAVRELQVKGILQGYPAAPAKIKKAAAQNATGVKRAGNGVVRTNGHAPRKPAEKRPARPGSRHAGRDA